MPDISLELLAHFHDCVTMGSCTEVAKKNFMTRTAISKQMKRLEAIVGVQLFVRHDNNHATATPAAIELDQRAQAMLAMFSHTITHIRAEAVKEPAES